MGGQKVLGRHVGVLQGPEDGGHPVLGCAHVEHHQARLAGDHAAQAGLRGQASQLLARHRRATVVGDGHLHADDLVDETDITLDIAGESLGGDPVVAGEHPGGQSLLLQGPDLEEQILQTPGDAVRPQQAHHGGDAVEGKVRQLQLRRPGGGALFTAAAGNVDMLVDEAGADDGALQIPDGDLRRVQPEAQIFPHGGDLVALDEDVPQAQVGRGIDVAVSPKCQHGAVLLI